MELITQTRTITGKKVRSLRRQRFIPAVMYGKGMASRPVSVGEAQFLKVWRSVGESALIDLRTDEAIVKVLIKEVAMDPVSGRIQHVDFQAVNMAQKLKTKVPIALSGEAPAVKERGAVLVLSLDHLEIECLPQGLFPEYVVDVRKLVNIGDMIKVRDLIMPEGIHVLTKPDAVVVVAEAPRVEEKTSVTAAPADLSAVKTEQEVKRAEKQAKREEEKKIE